MLRLLCFLASFSLAHGQTPTTRPSDHPSSVPSMTFMPTAEGTVSATRESSVPTIMPSLNPVTSAPTEIPICPDNWRDFRTCFANELDDDRARECDLCVGAAFPPRGSPCVDYSTSICTALTETCDCGPCAPNIERYFLCVFGELDLTCPLDCGLASGMITQAPSPAPATTTTTSTSGSSSIWTRPSPTTVLFVFCVTAVFQTG